MAEAAFTLPYLGEVRLEHRLIDYDGPFLFTVRSSNGGRYLGFSAAAEQDRSTYWYSAISDKRYRRLLRSEIGPRVIFADPEQGYVLEVELRGDGSEESVYKRPDTLDQDALPTPDFVLDIDVGAKIPASVTSSANFVAIQLQRLVARIIFEREDHSAPATSVASTIRHLQGVIDSLAYSKTKKGQATDSGPVPNEITEKTSLLLVPVFAGSLGIELVAETPSDWFGSIVEDSFNDLMGLLEAGSDQQKLKPLFSRYTSRTVNHYRKLIDSWAALGSGVAVETGSPKPEGERLVQMSKSDITRVVESLYLSSEREPRVETYLAELVGFNKRVKSFELRRISDDARVKGRVSGAVLSAATVASIGHLYNAKTVTVVEYDDLAETSKRQVELVELEQATD